MLEGETFAYSVPGTFAEDVADPERWRSVASHLLASARVLWPVIEQGFQERGAPGANAEAGLEGLRHRGPFLVLAGLAIENMLKALIVLDHNKRQQATGRADPPTIVKTHKLLPLARLANVPIDGWAEKLLDRLTMFVYWGGRYPIPLEESAYEIKWTSSRDMHSIGEFMKVLEHLYQLRLRS